MEISKNLESGFRYYRSEYRVNLKSFFISKSFYSKPFYKEGK
jgi:hypothetical protein